MPRIPPRSALLVVIAALIPAAALPAQEHDHAGHQPYAGLQEREIKAISPEEVAGLRAGEGLGMALAAELNGWPGPKHVLELADPLGLGAEQRTAVEEVRARMEAEAVRLGVELLEAEAELDRRFAHGHAPADDVTALSVRIGELRGRLRAVHLTAHLETRALLEGHQVEAYNRLRGYSGT